MLINQPTPFALAFRFQVYLPWLNTRLALCLKSVLNVKAQVGFQQGEGHLVKLIVIKLLL